MKRVVIRRPGGHDRLEIVESPDPLPGPKEVVIAAESIGVNFADCVVRMGLYESAKQYVGWPITPGFEVAGRVENVGSAVTDLETGAPVVGLTRFGGYATRVVLPRRQVFRVTEPLDLLSAGGFFVAHLTAWYALRELCKLRAGYDVLVHSAAGGVGGALVQIAKAAGCRVVGVVGGAQKIDAAHSLGADRVIDKSSEPLWAAAERWAPNGYHVVLDANGVETIRQSYAHLAPTGRLIVYGFHTMLRRGTDRPNLPKLALDYLKTPRFNPIDMTNRNKAVLGFNLSYLFDRLELLEEATGELFELLTGGRLRLPAITPFPFDQVEQAHRALESGRTVGKLVLRP